MAYGLLGRTLRHSFSPAIHKELGNNDYQLFEREPQDLPDFFQTPSLQGINITIPYKVEAMRACATVQPTAQRIGCVNTMVRRNGKWHGYNTDYDGCLYTFRHAHIDISGKHVLILGDGASSRTVHVAAEDLGAASITHLSRHQRPLYEDISQFYDMTQIIVNTTPVGMYPNCPQSIITLAPFKRLEGVVDIVYNPARTGLLLQAEKLGIPYVNGLPFLVAQAVAADQHFRGTYWTDTSIRRIWEGLRRQTENIILIGMPGVGKTTVGAILAEYLGCPFYDADQELSKIIGPISPYILEKGEPAFRLAERKILGQLARKSGIVLSTGGGCVTVPSNYDLLKQNGTIIQLTQPVEMLAIQGRVLSAGGPEHLQRLADERAPMYEAFRDFAIAHHRVADDTVHSILTRLGYPLEDDEDDA